MPRRPSLPVTDPTTELASLVSSLEAYIAQAPGSSYTAARARELLQSFAEPSCPLDAVAKVRALRGVLNDFASGLRFVDPIRHGPGCGRQSHPRFPRVG